MTDPDEQLEAKLRARPLPGLSAESRRRLLQDLASAMDDAQPKPHDVPVDDEPTEESIGRIATEQEQTPPRSSWWSVVATAATLALVWMNLSISATTATGFRVPLATAADFDRLVAEIHELLPELSAKEARRQAFLLRTRETLVLLPELPPPSITQLPPYRLGQLSE
jgi:hypothetical protein